MTAEMETRLKSRLRHILQRMDLETLREFGRMAEELFFNCSSKDEGSRMLLGQCIEELRYRGDFK